MTPQGCLALAPPQHHDLTTTTTTTKHNNNNGSKLKKMSQRRHPPQPTDKNRRPGLERGGNTGENNGKDHWSVGSMLLMGKGIRGGRVLGATTERHRPLTVNPQTLELDENGIRLKPAHVHRAIHRAAGITELEALRRHPVDGENLDLLT